MDHTIGPKTVKNGVIIPRRRRGTWDGVPAATWCSEWIYIMRGGLVHHIFIIPAALSLLLLRGATVGCAPILFENNWFCTRIFNFFPISNLFDCYTPPRVGREINPLGLVTHGQRNKPWRAYQGQRHKPRTCQSKVNTLHWIQVDGLARITELT